MRGIVSPLADHPARVKGEVGRTSEATVLSLLDKIEICCILIIEIKNNKYRIVVEDVPLQFNKRNHSVGFFFLVDGRLTCCSFLSYAPII